ncbi:MAG: 1-deoxy-D-xylulose-5-phosphate synthase [Clostridia bacterium]|nr:1-deoxy-D-xylulose-5-phosphate synthase [Clostridia bacterium]
MSFLERIKSPVDVKALSVDELDALAGEIRGRIIEVIEKNGGHLSSNLGAVDVIVALCYTFDFPIDKLLFDVGHQSYAYKILTGRNDEFDNIRKFGGISGFQSIAESEYDAFGAGHAGNSLSAALGICAARDLSGENYNVIDFVGDASFFNGENLEALSSDVLKPKKLIVILNDNGMSISKNDNALYKFFSNITTKKSYGKFMFAAEKTLGKTFVGKLLKKFKKFVKFNINKTSVVEALGFKYVGIYDGHNIKELVRVFKNIKDNDKAVLLHLKTVKGKGMSAAESEAEYFHGVGKNLTVSQNTFSQKAGNILLSLAEKDKKIVAVCAGMKDGTGLKGFAEKYPDRFFDVGIAEEHAVTFAAGMARGGLRPVVCVYSTFLQRSYDQIMEDVCLQDLPVIFLVDRAGAVGQDGSTHQGVFDISYLRHLPNMSVFAPKDEDELEMIVKYCVSKNSPCAIRYPNGKHEKFPFASDMGERLWEGRFEGEENVVLAVGPKPLKIALKAAEGERNICVVNSRSIKPLDEEFLLSVKDKRIITIEDNVVKGGFGSSVLEFYSEKGIAADVKVVGFPDEFIKCGNKEEQFTVADITVERLKRELRSSN